MTRFTLAAALLLTAAPVHAANFPQSTWQLYERHTNDDPHPFSGACCNQNDCLFAKPGSVTWQPGGVFRVILPDGKTVDIEDTSQQIKQYPRGFESERRAGACFGRVHNNVLEHYRLNAPEIYERMKGSPWFVRCLYISGGGT